MDPQSWKNSLLDLSSDRGALVALPGADPVKLALTLAGGGAFAFEAGCDPAGEGAWLRVPLPTPELERRLVTMRRAQRAELVDRGGHALWLALGALTWIDAAGITHTSPLALWPADLERAHEGLRLIGRDGIEPRLNEALAAELRALDLILAVPGDDDPAVSLDLMGLFDVAEGLAVTRPGWKVERTVQLGVFAPGEQLVAADGARASSPVLDHLRATERQPFAQPVIDGSAASGGAARPGEPGLAISAADAVTQPSDVIAPLDADASQLAAIAAAARGASFVLTAPPGTGASQTIANLVAHCISHGKTVLVASDRIAALEAVHQRLSSVGLSEFCLPLATAERAAVLAQLGRVFERSFRPGTGPHGDDARLVELRTALDTYVQALHHVGTFGRSVHDVLGRLVELRTTPRAELAEQDAVGLDKATFERRRAAVTNLAAAAVPVEPVATHPWRASTLDRLPPGGTLAVLSALELLGDAVCGLAEAASAIGEAVPGIVTATRDQLIALGELGALAAASPRPGAELLTQIKAGRGIDLDEAIALIRARGTGAIETPRDPLAFLQLAHKHRALAIEVEDVFTETVEQLDAPALWAQLRKWTTSMGPLRYVALRNARAEIKAAAMPAQLESDAAMITALEAVMAERASRSALLAAAEPAARWFGELGGSNLRIAFGDAARAGEAGPCDPLKLDLARIDAAVIWAADLKKAFDAVALADTREVARQAAWRALVAQVAAGPSTSTADLAPFARVAEAVARWQPALAALADAVGIPAATLAAGDDHLAALRERVDTLRHALDALPAWVMFHAARHGALAAGVGPAVAAIERGDLGATELAAAWERATLLAWGDAELTALPALAQFHGATHHAQVSAFADLDRGALALARARALVRLADRVPRIAGKLDPASTDPLQLELLALQAQLKQQRGPCSLRRLFAELPTLLPRLAPCLLGTPLAIAQHLDPALPAFDLVVIDGASRVMTTAMAGALGRAKAAVIVGDAAQRGVFPSLLDDALAANLPELSLSWHYRSRHEDLIAFANARWYGGRLQVFPIAHGSPDLGVSLRPYDTETLVGDVLARLRDPMQRTRSIAIVASTPAQAERIEDLLDAALTGEPVVDGGQEPLIVRDIAGIAGIERDVVLFAIDAAARLDARALAIATTCGREQLVVYAVVAPEDLGADHNDLAALLTFARAGGGAAREEVGEPTSPIAAAIARALGERGWAVRHRVGVGAYRLDLAVVDPSDPERYVLAIELDGPAYASAATARDRDRVRAQVLASLGWRVHRIWGLDWWAEPEREIQRAHGAIVTAIAATRQRRAPAPGVNPRAAIGGAARPGSPGLATQSPPRAARGSGQLPVPPVVKIPPRPEPVLAAGSGPTEATSTDATPLAAYEGQTTPTRIKKGTIAIGPYSAAAIPNGRRTPDDMFAPRHLAELGKVIEQVLAAEAPMHLDLLSRRVGGYFGIGRVTQRVTDQVKLALAGRARFGTEDNVVWRLDQDPDGVPPVRVAGQGPTAKRDIAEVPLSELASAARIVVERANGIAPKDLVRDAARLLGFARITEQVIDRVTLAVRLAAARELINITGNKVTYVTE